MSELRNKFDFILSAGLLNASPCLKSLQLNDFTLYPCFWPYGPGGNWLADLEYQSVIAENIDESFGES